MRISTVLSLGLSILTATASLTSQPNLLNLVGLDQVPLAAKDEPLTRTKTITHTHFEVNVVSTVYQTKPQPTQTQVPIDLEGSSGGNVPVWYSQPESGECNLQTCAVCYLVNKCDEGEDVECPNCDHAGYCQGCTPTVRMTSINEMSVETHSTCVVVPGQGIACDTEVRAEAHHADISDTTP